MKTRGNSMKLTFILVTMTAILLTLFPVSPFISNAEAASIVVDGDSSDWAGIPAISTNSGTARVLKASHDDVNLYLLVEGSGLSTTMGSFWLNTDGNASTGYQAYGWGTTGIEWLLENQSLYRYSGDGSSWNWDWSSTLSSSQYVRTSSTIEAAIPLSTLGLTVGSTVNIGYLDNNSNVNRLPAQNQSLPVYTINERSPGGNMIEFYPPELNDPLNNPFKGWAPSAKSTSYPQDHRLVYVGVTWKELEPTKGSYDFDAIEAANHFSYWQSRGVKVVLRFILDSPTGVPHRDIPDWLYNDMVSLGQSPGTAYQDATGGMGAGNNTGFSPNYSSDYLIARHKLAIEAIAAHYNTPDSPIAFVQIGSLGHWAEFHTWPYVGPNGESNYTGAFPPNSISNQYIQHYIDAFAAQEDHTQLLIRRSVELAKNNNKGLILGMYNDVFGDQPSFDSEWGWYTGTQNGYWDDIGQQQPNHANFWDTRVSGGEFYGGANGMNAALTTGSGFNETLRQTELSKPSWLGPNAPASLSLGNPLQGNMNILKKRMGYHFVVNKAAYPQANNGSTLDVSIHVENKGVQHFPFNWPVEIQLRSGGTIVARQSTSADLRTWRTGMHTVSGSISTSTLPSGTYELAIAILDPSTNRPGVDFANTDRLADGAYKLGTWTK
ncbi:DUF4832 domain-containing protein [Paenibacillus glucanolyticus]|jgi:hypothetical protein|uniref:DUF4832 domain-containing protein n=1 Tax=Paenibacillus TaxID=44249 RepID=UPI0004BAA015|nr:MULTISPECIES: DUF4832 domain-containing protein [Paenibacillus]ANA82543.1 S-layer protein [Paenibacillus glucanolyticus]AVV58717.1 DUF4832 domain-containing protein [Paenibacillus glucanolyticus]MPY17324.1 DUF4832 domain-containing protein [Paenibacillus glucanolyticus]OMF68230.1 DUF4832 domain-containing protein [Paenibacillus glucanolyticus]